MTAGGDGGTIALSEEDRAILGLESPTIVGHVCNVILLGPGPVDAEAVRDRVQARLDAAPELRYRLGSTAGRPVWVPADHVDLSAHVVDRSGPPLDEIALRTVVAARFREHLDRTRPLWAIDVVRLADGGTALLWRLHHAVADGTTFLRLLRTALLDPQEPDVESGGTASPPPRNVIVRDHARRRAQLMGFLAREFAVQAHPSPFGGVIGSQREVAFVDTGLPELHAAARAAGATLNDAVLAVLAGALRRWLLHHRAPVGRLRVRVPVSLHHDGADALNRDSYFSLPLPLHILDPVERLRAVHCATTTRKDAHDAERMYHLVHGLPGRSPQLRRVVSAVQASSREFAVSVSNVAVPRWPVAVLGREVRSIRPVVEIGRRHALRVSACSTGDTLAFGLCVDPGVVADVGVIGTGLEQEIALLVDVTRVRETGGTRTV